jgi:hypothetical protein
MLLYIQYAHPLECYLLYAVSYMSGTSHYIYWYMSHRLISPKIYTWSKTPLMLDPFIYTFVYIYYTNGTILLYAYFSVLIYVYILLYRLLLCVLLHCNNTMSKAPMRPLIVWYASYLSIYYYIYLTGRSCRLFIRSLSSKT